MKKILSSSSICLISFCYWQNNSLVVTPIEYINKKIPQAFNNFKILQISDLHNKEFGENQSYLVQHTKEISPDIIVITGDLIDGSRTNIDIAIEYVKQAKEIAPIYFVAGNHEEYSKVYNDLKKRLEELGIIILDDKRQVIEKDRESNSFRIKRWYFFCK
jgi:predicted MPP superfamily phosphohydrolase